MKNFTQRLKRCQRKSGLTVSDLAHFFGRRHRSVAGWLTIIGHELIGPRKEETLDKLDMLERFIQRSILPSPLLMSTRYRATYMRLLGEGDLARARLFKADPSNGGISGRVRQKRRAKKAAGIRDNRAAACLAATKRRGWL